MQLELIQLGTVGGGLVNENFEALTPDKKIIPGVYAVGNDASGMFDSSYPTIEGLSNAFAWNSGRIAGEKDDLVRMPSHVELAIRRYLSARNASDTTDPLFASISNHNNQGRMTTRSIRRIVKTIFISAGFDSPRLTAHSTRHTAATKRSNSSANSRTLTSQKYSNHRNLCS